VGIKEGGAEGEEEEEVREGKWKMHVCRGRFSEYLSAVLEGRVHLR